MKSSMTSGLLVILLAVLLMGLALPGWAGDVTVNAVAATQYDFGFFIALVYANGTEDLVDVQLIVNNDTPSVVMAASRFKSWPTTSD